MINLLTPATKLQLRQEIRHRRLVVAGFIILALLIVALILGSLILWQLHRETNALATTSSEPDAAALARQATKQELQAASADLQAIKSLPPRAALTALWRATLASQPASVALAGWRWQAGAGTESATLEIAGQAATRAGLLQFIETLKRDERFANVESPVSNLIRSKDIDFTLKLTLARAKN
ncbi:MAG: hypothetical protein AAB364_03160 [Patescibacteria group bacterium]